MCVTCGCSSEPHQHPSTHKEVSAAHSHVKAHNHDHGGIINLEAEILAENNQYAAANRELFKQHSSLALNFVSSPGSGKTTLLEATISKLSAKSPIYVIEGDQHTELDAERIRRAGAEAYQIQTGKACHLDGHMVGHALEHLELAKPGFVFIENVGNLICPALFDLGEHARVVLISVTEGEDKPLKYPDMFFAANLVLITKVDLLPYVNFNLDTCLANIGKINPKARVLQVSATTGEGIAAWLKWLDNAKAFLV